MPEPGKLPPALKVAQVAELANVSTDTLYESIQAGTCPWPVLRIGRAIRIPRAAVLESLALTLPEEDAQCEPS